jgi:glyoxylase-like metal-dependent hydrolase (beta-lactamase superfamily II)
MVMPSVEQVQPGVWSIPVPIPNNPLGYTLVYALATDRGPVLIDAGWHDPETLAALDAGVRTAGFELSEVHGVLVTHHHPDHHGLAGEVRERSGAWVALHAADAEIVRAHRGSLTDRKEDARQRTIEALHAAGAPPEEAEALLAHHERLELELPALPDRELTDGELADTPGRELRVIWTPGHSPGHVCLHLADADVLFAGDHALPGITPHVGLYEFAAPDANPLGDFLASLRRVADLAPSQVLPAHQERFEDLPGRVDALLAHHEERFVEIEQLMATAGPLTMWEVAERMTWYRTWDELPPIMRRIAMSEAAAHVRYLERAGRVTTILESRSGPDRYDRAAVA